MKQRNSTIDERPLRSNPGDFDRFIGSSIWYDMQGLIKDRIEYLQAQLLESNDTDINSIIARKNQMKAWKEMLGVPSYLKSCAHQEKQTNQNELEL